MESISIMDGLTLTIVSMLVVFGLLAAIWGLIEIIARFVQSTETEAETSEARQSVTPSPTHTDNLAPNAKHQEVAELMALVLASEDEANKKFEIVETKRIK